MATTPSKQHPHMKATRRTGLYPVRSLEIKERTKAKQGFTIEERTSRVSSNYVGSCRISPKSTYRKLIDMQSCTQLKHQGKQSPTKNHDEKRKNQG